MANIPHLSYSVFSSSGYLSQGNPTHQIFIPWEVLAMGNPTLVSHILNKFTLDKPTYGNPSVCNFSMGDLNQGNITLGNADLGFHTLDNHAIGNPSLGYIINRPSVAGAVL